MTHPYRTHDLTMNIIVVVFDAAEDVTANMWTNSGSISLAPWCRRIVPVSLPSHIVISFIKIDDVNIYLTLLLVSLL